jgi:hypothetical protein
VTAGPGPGPGPAAIAICVEFPTGRLVERVDVHITPDRFYCGAMTEFVERDLSGARFERVSLRNASFNQVGDPRAALGEHDPDRPVIADRGTAHAR